MVSQRMNDDEFNSYLDQIKSDIASKRRPLCKTEAEANPEGENAPKRRGRPKGSKNKPKNAVRVSYMEPTVLGPDQGQNPVSATPFYGAPTQADTASGQVVVSQSQTLEISPQYAEKLPETPKRKRGRPKGSKNKPKDPSAVIKPKYSRADMTPAERVQTAIDYINERLRAAGPNGVVIDDLMNELRAMFEGFKASEFGVRQLRFYFYDKTNYQVIIWNNIWSARIIEEKA